MSLVSVFKRSYLPAAAYALLVALAGCSTPEPKIGLRSGTGMYASNGATAGPEYFSAAAYGVAASPRVVSRGSRLPRGGGRDQIGKPYTVKGRTYVPTASPKKVEVGLASWYGAAFHGRLTANGEVYDMGHLTAAHKTMPLPSYARVTNMDNGRSVIVRVNDRGPFASDRVIDLSKRAAELLDYTHSGTAEVKVEYAGRAPLDGQDDQFLIASVRGVPGYPSPDRFGQPSSAVLIAMNGPTPVRPKLPPEGLPGVGTDFLTTGGTVPSYSPTQTVRVSLPVQIPLPGDRPDAATGGVAVSAYATMRVTGAFDWTPVARGGTDWKTR
jgi:peptidoglycan lytic transglycosylase